MEKDTTEIHALLDWYKSAGVDEIVEESPQSYFGKEASSPPVIASAKPATVKSASSSPVNAVATSMTQLIADTKDMLASIDSLDEFYESVRQFNGCNLKKTARNTVIYDGIANSDLMVIGEAPGEDEDKQGIPFCGVSGQLLDKILASAGYERNKNFYITNMVFWRPPGNRNPTAEELAICRPFVEKHIALIKPKLLLLVGGISAKELLNASAGITKLRGHIQDYHSPLLGKIIPAMPILHPSYLLRQPSQKKLAWQDMLALQDYMRQLC